MHHALTEQLESFGFTPSQIESLLEIAKPLELPTRHILTNQARCQTRFTSLLKAYATRVI